MQKKKGQEFIRAGSLKKLPALFYPKMNYMIYTFPLSPDQPSVYADSKKVVQLKHFFSSVYLIRLHTENCQKIFVFSQKIDIYSDSIWAKSTFVESFWS